MKFFKITGAFLIGLSGCVESYEPPVIKEVNHYLVVEGRINTDGEISTIKLSRSTNLSDTAYIQEEEGAVVAVVGENMHMSLTPQGKGVYSASLNINTAQPYYLEITTEEGKVYRSQELIGKYTPPIDSINWEILPEQQIQLYVNTHDPTNESQYYQWDYVETWEFHAAYQSYLNYVNGKLIPRTEANQIYTCWHSDHSTSILLGSSAQLSEDIIYQKPLVTVPFKWKLSSKYSILVTQYTLTQEAYQYLENMKKNSEDLGSFFDSQPVELQGNLYCVTTPGEPVIGYVTSGVQQEKRIYITSQEVDYFEFDRNCETQTVSGDEDFDKLGLVPLYSDPLGIISTTKFCGDCSLRGTTEKPSFWE